MRNKALVIGCGLTGAVIARELADKGIKVTIWEKRNHIGGNLYDEREEHDYLVQRYGPHAFHTKEKNLYDYVCRFAEWRPYRLNCGAQWDGNYTSSPFNYTTIDTFYPKAEAARLKEKFSRLFARERQTTVVEALNHPDADVRQYAQFLLENDYAPYTAKQWGVSTEAIDPSVLKRVPLRFSYDDGYFDDLYQILPAHSYTEFFENLLDHENIDIYLEKDALHELTIENGRLTVCGEMADYPVVYTGAVDELFGCIYGKLPYRSLRFEWHYAPADSFQQAAIVAYPKAEGYTRITEYKKLPEQTGEGTVYAVEYPLPYQAGQDTEPYYPILTMQSRQQYAQYRLLADAVEGLYCCGRLGDYKYYNMDQALKRALECAEEIWQRCRDRER